MGRTLLQGANPSGHEIATVGVTTDGVPAIGELSRAARLTGPVEPGFLVEIVLDGCRMGQKLLNKRNRSPAANLRPSRW